MPERTITEETQITRRSFLGKSLWAGVELSAAGLFLQFCIGHADEPEGDKGATPQIRSPIHAKKSARYGLSPNVFVNIAPDNQVTIVCHRSEMGQGIRSSLPILIADELGADLKLVNIVQGDGDAAYGDQNTDGSNSVRSIFEDMRRVGATARIMLIQAAAKVWQVEPNACEARNNFVIHRPTHRQLSFGELAQKAAEFPIPKKTDIQLRPISELKHLGAELPLLDAPAYVTGAALFGADIQLPEMLIAVVARPPVVGGSIAKYDASRALKIPGVKRIVEIPNPKPPYEFQPWGGIAVLAESTWAAMKGRAALEITWKSGKNANYDSHEYRKFLSDAVRKPGKVIRKKGDANQILSQASQVIDAEYHIPHLAHVPMEPPSAIAQVTESQCEIWAPTQNPQSAKTVVAHTLGIPESKVQVHVTFLGGAFGRKSKSDFIAEAAYLSKKAGVPVRVQWTREDDLQHDYYHSVSTQRLTASFDEKGKLAAWRHRTAFPPIATVFGGSDQPGESDLQQGVMDLPLDTPNILAEACAAPAYVRIGWLRSVYNIFHSFAINSFMDELAHTRNKDPKDFYLEVLGPGRKLTLQELGIKNLKNYGATLEDHPIQIERYQKVIDRVTQIAPWATRKKEGRALGLAVHRSFLSYVATVVSVKPTQNGKIAVDEVWLVIDPGTILNRDRVRSQMEGAVIFGMSIAFYGAATMKGGITQQTNFDSYRLVRMQDTPKKIHVEILPAEHAPGGIGEPGVPPVAPAITNAIFALTGKRIRDLPLSAAGLV